MENNTELVALCTDKAKQWLSPSFDEGTRKSVQAMLDNSDKTELIECFYKDLEFGTGGLRGIMGAGSNRMNIYTVGMPRQSPTYSPQTASRYIFSTTCVLHRSVLSRYAISDVRLV